MNALYFAEDGSWGNAEDILILDEDATDHFTQAVWERISDASDNERLDIARHFAYNECVTNDDTPECQTCGLTANQIN